MSNAINAAYTPQTNYTRPGRSPFSAVSGLLPSQSSNPFEAINALSDSFASNPAIGKGFTYAKSQFSFQQSTIEYMESDTGFSYYQKEVSFEITSEKFRAGTVDEAAIQELTDYFSPENTANRITNLATSFFPLYAQQHNLEDTPEARQEFVSLITPSIDKGYEQALGELGSLPEEISSELEKTMELVKNSLAAFANGEEPGYHEKARNIVEEQYAQRDSDGDGLISREESGLSEERFTQLDRDADGLITLDEITDLIAELDPTKDLNTDLALSILDTEVSAQELAERAKGLLSPENSISLETLSLHIEVSETIIEYSAPQTEPDGNTKFASFLDSNTDAQEEINNTPASIARYLNQYKLESVLEQIKERTALFSNFTEEFFQNHEDKLNFLFENPSMIDFFEKNEESATKFIQ
jgi:hypothetical protein